MTAIVTTGDARALPFPAVAVRPWERLVTATVPRLRRPRSEPRTAPIPRRRRLTIPAWAYAAGGAGLALVVLGVALGVAVVVGVVAQIMGVAS